VFGFAPLPASLVGAIAAITGLYVVATELTKRWFYRSSRDRARNCRDSSVAD
jgi:hypothetical protein